MDSWEDFDEDEIQQQQSSKQNQNQEEEEDLTLIEQKEELKKLINKPKLNEKQINLLNKKLNEEEILLQNELLNTKLENETNEEKIIRERKQVEEADVELSVELFNSPDGVKRSTSSSSASGLSLYNLKNKEDHINFGIMTAKKLENSTAFCITAYLKEIITRRGDTLTAETLADLAETIKKLQTSKKQADDLNASKNQKSKKQQKAQAKKHEQVFGGAYDQPEEYEDYANIEDDFM